jgi:prephenate dehydrogenase
MEAGFRLRNAKIAIIGLGLMGGSLALALKGKCAALYGIDSNPATLKLALAQQIVEQADSDSARLLPQADLLILATPVPAIIDFIQKLPALTPNPCIVLDLGSSKTDIVRAMSILPESFDPIGGHPICGKEKLGLKNADGSIFQDAAFIMTPLARTTARAREAAKEIVSTIGARLIILDAEEHDQALAFTSHLPFLLSSALILSTPSDVAPFIGTGFRSVSRLADTPSSMMLGVMQSNRENILKAIEMFSDSLNRISTALQDENYHQLELLINQSRASYQSLVSNL